MARKRKEEEHENHERWLVSYADFITLLFAFFVVMYSVSSVNDGKYRVLSNSLLSAFRDPNRSLEPIQIGHPTKSPFATMPNMRPPAGQTSDPSSADPDAQPGELPTNSAHGPKSAGQPGDPGKGGSGDAAGGPEAAQQGEKAGAGGPAAGGQTDKAGAGGLLAGGPGQKTGPGPLPVALPGSDAVAYSNGKLEGIKSIFDKLGIQLAPLIDKKLIAMRRENQWIELEMRSNILFASGSARLETQAIPVLEELAGALRGFDNPIQVEGFTDNRPISTLEFPSNWELSAARAASVVHLFTRLGVRPGRMAAVGYGEYRPVASNATAEGRQKNRRVLIIIAAKKETQRVVDLERAEANAAPAPAPAPATKPVTAAPSGAAPALISAAAPVPSPAPKTSGVAEK